MNLRTAISEFLIAGEADGLSPKTISWYAYMLGMFADAMPQGAALDQISTAMIRQYIIGVRRQHSENTASGVVRSLHKFWRWCSAEYDHRQNPMRNIKYQQPAKRTVPGAIAPDDAIRLFQATTPDRTGIRDRAILAVLIDSTIRAGGLVSMRMIDLDLIERRAIIIEKGDKARAIALSQFTCDLLAQWVRVRDRQCETVFHNIYHSTPLTVSGLQQLTKRLKKRAGVTGRVNPHSFRHGFAREYLRSGGDLATLSKLMGHASVETTAHFYAVYASDELSIFHDQRSPIEILKRSLDGSAE